MLLRNVFITIALLAFASGYSQTGNYVKLVNEKGKREAFVIKDTPRAERVNGRLNISILAKDNRIFQVNNIDEKLLKDTSLVTKDVALVLINPKNDCTFKNNSSIDPVRLKIILKNGGKTGTNFRICASGKLYCNEGYYTVKLNVNGKIPPPRFIRTY